MPRTSGQSATPPNPSSPPDAGRTFLAAALKGEARRLRLAGLIDAAGRLLWLPQAWLIAGAIGALAYEPAGAGPAVRAAIAIGLALALLRAAAELAAGRIAFAASKRVRAGLRADLVAHFSRMPALDTERIPAGSTAALLAEHVEALDPYIVRYRPASVRVAVVPPVFLAAIFAVNWAAGLMLLLAGPLIPLFMALVGIGARAASERQLSEIEAMGGHFLDRLSGILTIRLLDAAGRVGSEIATIADRLRARTMAVLRIAFLSSAVLELFSALGIAMVAILIGFNLLGQISIGRWGAGFGLREGLFALMLAPAFFEPLRELAAAWHDRAAALAAADHLGRIAAPAADDIVGEADAPASGEGPPRIELKGLGFGYGPDRSVLRDLDLVIAPGERIAFTGPSGSGKSTLLALLMGLIEPDHGVILLDGQPCQRGAAARIRERAAFIGQHHHLFHGSVIANLRLADPEASRPALMDALALASADAVVARLPRGLDTRLGEGGFGLSGGEARRLAIARLALRDAPILIADEPTADLDRDTAAAIIRAIDRLAEGRTLILATHDPALIALASRVFEIDASGGLREVCPPARAADRPPEPASPARPAVHRSADRRGPAITSVAALPSVLRLVLGERVKGLFLGTLLAIATAASGVGLLGLAGWLITAAALAGMAGPAFAFDVFRPAAAVRALAVLRTAGRYCERLVTHEATLRVLARLRVRLFSAFAASDPLVFGRLRRADALGRLTTEVDALDGLYLRLLLPAATAAIVLAGLFAGLMLAYPAAAAAAGLVYAAVTLAGPGLAVRAVRRPARRLSAALDALRARVIDLVRGHADLMVHGRLAAQRAAIGRAATRLDAAQDRLNRIDVMTRALAGAGGSLALLAVLAAVTPAVMRGDLSAPAATLAMLAALAAGELIAPLARGAMESTRIRIAARRIAPALAPAAPAGAVATVPARPRLAFDAVTFRYGEARAPVIDRLTLAIDPGEAVALVGPSGEGKTTLLALAARLLVPESGAVRLGDTDIATLPECRLRRVVALCPQRVELFRDTIAGNLRLADPQASDEALWAALEAADLATTIARLPHGLATRLGEQGAGLSGGERRRLAVARTLLRPAPILLFDEATEGLDAGTAERMLDGLRRATAGRTLVLATHKAREAARCDRVIALRAGRIVAEAGREEADRFATILSRLRPD